MKISELITFAQAAKELPGRPSIATLHRWRQRGVRNVRLRTHLIGGRRYVDRADLEAFCVATTAAGEASPPFYSCSTPQREAAIQRAERQLDAEGVSG